MSESLVYHLDADPGRSHALDQCFYGLANLDRTRRFIVSAEEWNPKLPHNFMARVKIPVRQLAAFNRISYDEMNEIVHDLFYPRRVKVVAGAEYEVSCPSNKLTPEEARKIEADLTTWAGAIGCKLTWPEKWTA